MDQDAYVRYVGYSLWRNKKFEKKKATLESVSKDATDLCEFEEE